MLAILVVLLIAVWFLLALQVKHARIAFDLIVVITFIVLLLGVSLNV